MQVRIAHLVPRTDVEGPGSRSAVWVQGCSIRCPGCFNPHTWKPEGGRLVSASVLADQLSQDPDIEGVTFLGGEPFDQAAGLAEVGQRVRARGLSVMTFTGFTYERITEENRPSWHDLLKVTDLLVDGPYLRNAPDVRRPWVGSTNQRFICLTERYRGGGTVAGPHATLEVRIRADGTAFVNGMAGRQDLRSVRHLISRSPASAPDSAGDGRP